MELLQSDLTNGILCDIGMPVVHRSVRYNCRVFLLNQKIVLIRPKICMANDGNYRELRYFTPWHESKWYTLEDYYLPHNISEFTEQSTVPFGLGLLQLKDTCLAAETCEEMFTPQRPK